MLFRSVCTLCLAVVASISVSAHAASVCSVDTSDTGAYDAATLLADVYEESSTDAAVLFRLTDKFADTMLPTCDAEEYPYDTCDSEDSSCEGEPLLDPFVSIMEVCEDLDEELEALLAAADAIREDLKRTTDRDYIAALLKAAAENDAAVGRNRVAYGLRGCDNPTGF